MKKLLLMVAAAGVLGFWIIKDELGPNGPAFLAPSPDPVTPNWASIAAWPLAERTTVEAMPDPNRRITAIVLDDSGSMGEDMQAAKDAVLLALDAMAPHDRVAVVALNKGVVLPFTEARAAKAPLKAELQYVLSDGRTPLTAAVQSAKDMLEDEAAAARSFGTYRMIVTTDGQANDGDALNALVENIAATTPIQVATIGIGIEGSHVLRRNDLGSFVDVSNVDALQSALQAAIAENTEFDAITDFGGQN